MTSRPDQTPDAPSWHADVPHGTRLLIATGVALLGLTVAGFGSWAATAPIAGAVVSTGSFVATGENKTVQHLEGGIISDILVSEGDEVRAGQTLIRLDRTGAETERRRIKLQVMRLSAVRARLEAEAALADGFDVPDELARLAESDAGIAEVIANQRLTFSAGRDNLASELRMLRESVAGLEARQEGAEVQLTNVNAQREIIADELSDRRILLDKGLTRRSEVRALERAEANLAGEIGRLTGEIGDARQGMARAREQIVNVRSRFVKSAVDNLERVSSDLADARERLRRADEVLERTEIRAPVAGVVVRLRYHTGGGVIEAGKPILELLPVREDLLLEARISPKDIDVVRRGQTATVRLTALNQRTTPMMSGEVVYLSADALSGGEALGDSYVARIKLEATDRFGFAEFRPTPGMPAEVLITTTDRTFLEYLLQPIRDSMARAFRET